MRDVRSGISLRVSHLVQFCLCRHTQWDTFPRDLNLFLAPYVLLRARSLTPGPLRRSVLSALEFSHGVCLFDPHHVVFALWFVLRLHPRIFINFRFYNLCRRPSLFWVLQVWPYSLVYLLYSIPARFFPCMSFRLAFIPSYLRSHI